MLFDGVAEAFYQPQIEVMEQVVDSDCRRAASSMNSSSAVT